VGVGSCGYHLHSVDVAAMIPNMGTMSPNMGTAHPERIVAAGMVISLLIVGAYYIGYSTERHCPQAPPARFKSAEMPAAQPGRLNCYYEVTIVRPKRLVEPVRR
jgi:hypothetical protein